MRGCREDERLICSLVVSGSGEAGAGFRDYLRAAVEEFDNVGDMEEMLVESREEEDFVALERAAYCASDLLLAVVRLECKKRVGRAKGTVAQVIKSERGALHRELR